MPWWPFASMIREQSARKIAGGKKRDRGKSKASRAARKRNR